LSKTGKFSVIELGHAAIAIEHGFKHVQYSFKTEAMPLRKICEKLLARRGELTHLILSQSAEHWPDLAHAFSTGSSTIRLGWLAAKDLRPPL
jgi:hypothetical protein